MVHRRRVISFRVSSVIGFTEVRRRGCSPRRRSQDAGSWADGSRRTVRADALNPVLAADARSTHHCSVTQGFVRMLDVLDMKASVSVLEKLFSTSSLSCLDLRSTTCYTRQCGQMPFFPMLPGPDKNMSVGSFEGKWAELRPGQMRSGERELETRFMRFDFQGKTALCALRLENSPSRAPQSHGMPRAWRGASR